MTNQTPNATINNEQEPFIPPYYMLILAAVGFIVALVVLLTQANFTVVGWGGLGLCLLSLVVWAFMAPDQARALVGGRTARYGGTTVIVTLVFLVALIAIYSVVKGRNLRLDLTQRDDFSLNNQTRQTITGLGIEPNVPNIKIYAFYGAAQAGRRDQDTILFDDYAQTSQNKISYEFVDPDRNPLLAQQFKVERPGQVVVVPLDAQSQPLTDKAQLINLASQEQLSNTIMRVAASGDFRAYFVAVEGGLKLDETGDNGLSNLNDTLKNRLNWKTEEVNLLDLTSPTSTINLSDAAIDGQTLVIAGGSKPLPDDQVKFISDFLDKGGKLVLLAAPLNADGSSTLATTESLNTYLYNSFGIRLSNSMVLDETQAFQTPFNPVAGTFDSAQYITQPFAAVQGAAMVFEQSRFIEVNPTLPADVTVSELAKSADTSYAKSDPAILTAGADAVKQVDTDAKGPFVLAAAAENSKTGARIVVFGSQFIPTNFYAQLRGLNVFNLDVAFSSVVWVTKFNDFFSQIPQLTAAAKPQDSPIFADEQLSRSINFLTLIILPFGVLIMGLLVWWVSRERRQA